MMGSIPVFRTLDLIVRDRSKIAQRESGEFETDSAWELSRARRSGRADAHM